MIPLPVLTVVMWSVMAAWAVTALIIAMEFRTRQRRDARAASMLQQLAAQGPFQPHSLPDVTAAQFQQLMQAGLPERVQTALAQEVRLHEGDGALMAVAAGETGAGIEERIQALQVITSGRHPETYSVLATALRADQAEIAAMALRLLRGLDNDQAVTVLVDALAQGVSSPSRIAAALDRMQTECSDLLGPLLQHESQTVKFWAILLIGRAGALEWTWGIRRLLTDRSPMVRRAAVEALGRLGSPDDRRPVLGRFLDPAPMVRVHAARAAAAFADASVADALVKLLGDREWIVRAAARDSLKALGEVATPALIRTLWQGDPFAVNNAAEVLFLTGATFKCIDDLVEQPHNAERRRLVDRLMAASGPQIVRAVHDHLEPGRPAELQQLLGSGTATKARVRSR